MATRYAHLTPKLAIQLAAPHTWPASLMPALLAVAFAAATMRTIPVVAAMVLLAIAVLTQSAVNAINDYFDFVKGVDTAADNVEETDAVLVYNDVPPSEVLALGIGFLVCALALGIYCIARAGWAPLAIAAIGAAAIFLYSGGRTPLSYAPLGEVVSGTVMGGLLPLASYQVLTRTFDPLVIVWSIPLIIGIALIMLTNNTCDIEKDIEAGRRTLPVLLGRPRSVILYRTLLIGWLVTIVCVVVLWFTPGVIVMPFMLLAAHAPFNALWANPFTNATRIQAMAQICSANLILGAFFAVAVFASSVTLMW